MPIDSSIYFQQQAPDILGSVQRGLTMRDMLDRKKLEGEAIAKQKAIDSAYQSGIVKNPDGTTSFDRKKTLSSIAGIEGGGKEYLSAEDSFRSRDLAESEAQRKKQIEKIDTLARFSGMAKDQQSYDQMRSQMTQMGFDVSSLPPAYDPNLMKRYETMALTAKERMEQQWKQKEFGLKEQGLGIKKQEIQGKSAKEAVTLATDLRKERSGLPTTKATAEVAAAYNKIQTAAKNPSPAGDLSLIFSYMKILDPGSTVREGEFANAQNAAGIPDQVMNAYNRALKGERLNPQQRNDFISQAGNLYKSQLAVQKQVDSRFGALAKKAGVDPNDVLLNYEAQNGAPNFNQMSDAEIDALYKQAGGK